tara:strand:+ start:312 stop:1622 length:1311 start_codon:yes stop_codon:yes gene_type:complete
MIPEQAKSEIIRKRAEGMTWDSIADWMDEKYGVRVHRTSIQRCHDRELWGEEEDFLPPEDRVRLDKQVSHSKGEANLYKKLYQHLLKDTIKQELIIESIQNLAPSFRPVPSVTYKRPKGKFTGRQAQTVVAPLTDTHIGESVNVEQMIGLNTYDFNIFNQRLYGWANQLLNLVNYRRNIAKIDNLIVPMLGDMISGDIHEELARSNISNCMEQMIRGANLIAQALMFLAPHFRSIKVPCVVGNHGRMTRKPPMKDKYMDWDYMMYQWIAAFCKKQKNITFNIPKSFISAFDVYNSKILIMHGDSISGAGSNMSIARAITALRGVLQYQDNVNSEVGSQNPFNKVIHFDSAIIGHFHRVDEIDIGTGSLHIAGCMKGPDEFALQRLHAATKPKQLALYYHPKYGYIGKEIIYLNRYDQSKNKFNDNVPDTWASLIIE